MIKRVNGAPGAGQLDVGEMGEIQTVVREVLVPKALPMLGQEEALASMPSADDTIDRKILLLNRAIGEKLTVNNPVWTGDPIPRMRALQKRLIAYSLTLETEERQPCMDAIRVVEQNVQLRLRWQQMKRSDLELDGVSEDEEGHSESGDEEGDAPPPGARLAKAAPRQQLSLEEEAEQ